MSVYDVKLYGDYASAAAMLPKHRIEIAITYLRDISGSTQVEIARTLGMSRDKVSSAVSWGRTIVRYFRRGVARCDSGFGLVEDDYRAMINSPLKRRAYDAGYRWTAMCRTPLVKPDPESLAIMAEAGTVLS